MADAVDNFAQYQPGLDSPFDNLAAVTPDDANDLAFATRGIIVTVAGDVTVDMVGVGTNVVLPGLIVGVIHSARVTRIYAAGTAATGIKAVW